MLRRTVLLSMALLVLPSTPLLAAKRVVIDVRTPDEYAQGHVPGALNLEYQSIAQIIAKAGVAKDDEVILYCRSGRRSSVAEESLRGMGYTKVENYGGLDEAKKRLGVQ